MDLYRFLDGTAIFSNLYLKVPEAELHNLLQGIAYTLFQDNGYFLEHIGYAKEWPRNQYNFITLHYSYKFVLWRGSRICAVM